MKLFATILKIVFFIIGLLTVVISFLFGYQDIPLEDLKAKYAKEPSSFIAVNGMQVHFRDEGKSKNSIPLVMLHGTGSSLHTFNDWAIQLKRDYRIIRMDLPAFSWWWHCLEFCS